MGVPGNANALLLASAAVSGGYQVSRSLRFNAADSAYLNRTPASASNQQTWTWSAWVKRSALATQQIFFDAYTAQTDTGYLFFGIGSDDKLFISGWNTVWKRTTQVFRDPSAWLCLTVAFDVTQATGTNRIKFFVNGTQITTFDTDSAPSQNTNHAVNGAYAHNIGRYSQGPSQYFSGYLADVFLIDGQALTPSSFTTTDSNGELQPIAYSGSYGTNGFKLNFSSNATTAALGTDTSGNGNTWTVNNFSVTAGSGNDSLTDTPTSYGTDTGVGGEVRGNYATLNPIEAPSASVVSNGNLQVVLAATGTSVTPSTIGVSSGKWYAEFTFSATAGGNAVAVGVGPAQTFQPNIFDVGVNYYANDGTKYVSGANTAYGTTWTTGDVIGIALNVDSGTVTFYKNNTSQGAITLPTSASGWKFCLQNGGGSATKTFDCNFGQRAFAYTAPSGFKALVDTNLPAPVVAKPDTVMGVVLRTGTGTSGGTISSLNFAPDLIWTKLRSTTSDHYLIDTVRGLPYTLSSNNTNAENNYPTWYTSTTSTGYTVGNYDWNTGTSVVEWCWDAGTSTVTNTAGSITSQVRANASAGFSVVTYSGANGGTVGHGLGVAPSFLIFKCRSNADAWVVYHKDLGPTSTLQLQSTNAIQTSDTTAFNSTAPTSTVFSVGSSGRTGESGRTYVCYAFAPLSGYSSVSSYLGNGSSDGPFQWCGFRPRFILLKSTSGSRDWLIYDTARGLYNPQAEGPLQPNTSGTPYGFSGYDGIDILSNGFKLRTGINNLNASGETHIFMAFAENPFQYARAR
jgi:hypothetical protein